MCFFAVLILEMETTEKLTQKKMEHSSIKMRKFFSAELFLLLTNTNTYNMDHRSFVPTASNVFN
jgi:hypothetical protein